MSTHNLCFGPRIRKKYTPFKFQFYYVTVGCIHSRTYYPDVLVSSKVCVEQIHKKKKNEILQWIYNLTFHIMETVVT